MEQLKLLPFQGEDYKTVVRRFKCRALVAWSQGLGKTVVSIKLMLDHVEGNIVVVCPAGAKEMWRRAIASFTGRQAHVLDGRKPYELRSKRQIYIVNYDILGLPSHQRKTWTQALRRIKPELVVVDEIQYVKESKAKRSRACKELCRGVDKVLGLSGTPMPNKVIELWYPLSIIKPGLFSSYVEFGQLYCAGKKVFGYWDFSGCSNPQELNTILRNEVMVRRRKEDVLDQLPPLTTTVEPFVLPPAALREYTEARTDFLNWLAKKDRKKANRAVGQEEITKLGYLKRLAAMLKLPAVIDWIRDFLLGDQKLIVYCIHHDFVNGLHAAFKDVSVVVTGKTPAKLRQSIFDKFNEDPKCRLLIGNIQAAGVFWSCRSASTVAHGEMSWIPADHAQGIDRVRGIKRGTGRPVMEYFLVASGTIEDKLCEILERKTGNIDAVIDGKRSSDMRVFSLLIEALKKEGMPVPEKKVKKVPPVKLKKLKARNPWLPKSSSPRRGKLPFSFARSRSRKSLPWRRR